jgi:glutaminyl-peptide cyclotransferase
LSKFIFIILLTISVTNSCRQANSTRQNNNYRDTAPDETLTNNINFISPKQNEKFKIGQHVDFHVQIDSAVQADSICFLINGKRFSTAKRPAEIITWSTQEAKVGEQSIEAIAYYGVKPRGQGRIKIYLAPGKPATEYTYHIINIYPHDPTAYTQGLIYFNNYLYESTGQYGQSTLRKVKLNTGEVTQVLNLPDEVFGEGITEYDNKIIQITWREQVAFIYDINSFRMLNKISYPMSEGWGITFDGTYLIMSDGSANLYFLEKEYFTEVNRIEVYDNKGPVKRLNELEYIDGEIWANIFTTDTIIRINPKTAAVTGKIALKGLLKAEYRSPETNVLNGIAYDPITKRIFVTGKNWSRLFEISVSQSHQ